MKLIAAIGALLMTIATSAVAQSSVTLYGVVDNGVSYINNKGGSSSVAMADGIARSNRFGLTGQEDLGSGLKAIFKLESTYSLNTGALSSNALFGHEAYVGMSDDRWGQVTLGRQYDFTAFMYPYIPCLYCGIYVVGNADLDRLAGEAINNVVKFTSRDIGGLNLGAMYAFGQTGSGATNYGRAYSLSAEYKNGPFSMMAVTTNINGAITHAGALGTTSFLGVSNTALALPVDNQRVINVGASWKFGAFKADVLYTNTRLTLGEEASTDQALRAGGEYNVMPDLMIAGAAVVEKFEASRWYNLHAGVNYLLSKRTNVYVAGLFQRATGPGTVASIATAGLSSTNSQVIARVGMTHTF